MRSEDKALVLGVVASVLAHVVGTALLPVSAARAGAARDPREVEFTVSLPEPEPARTSPPRPPPRREPALATRAPSTEATPQVSSNEIRIADLDAPPADPDAEPTPPEPVDEEARRRRRAALLDLSPEAVARAGFRFTLPSGPRDPDSGRRPEDPGRTGAFYGERETSLATGLARDANRRPTGRRPPPVLRRRTDGSYHWDGPLVRARIGPDGAVSFEDGPGMSVGLGEGGGTGLGGRFDLSDAIERGRGNDPRRAEKQWFLRETEALRDRLATAAQAERLSLAERRLLGRLRSIWGNRDTAPDVRRLRIFRLWDQLSEDEVGDRARAVVERFVRNELPPGSEHAFGPAELAELNRRRASRDPFRPYR